MTTIHLTATTPVAPEHIIRAFTDFTPQRLRTFPNIDPRYYQVHAVQATSAEVTEGSAIFGDCCPGPKQGSSGADVFAREGDSQRYHKVLSWFGETSL